MPWGSALHTPEFMAMSHPHPTVSASTRWLSPHSGLFIAAFVCANLAALAVAYAAAHLLTPASASALTSQRAHAVHHLGRMTLIPLRQPPAGS